jgi:uncharacterized membrane protein
MTASSSPPARPYSRVTTGVIAVLAGLIVGLWLFGTPPGLLGKADAIGYAICHRIAERSFHTHDRPLPLCARCTGIYLGVLTGLVFFVQRGRARAGNLPPTRILLTMGLLGTAYAFDGLNSYLSIFKFYTPLYPPHNTLRLFTGLTFGLAMITVVLPVFSTIAWADPKPGAVLRSFKEMGVLYGAAGIIGAAVLIDQPTLRAIFGLISVIGVVIMFAVIGIVMFLITTRRENSVTRWRDLIFPALVGLTFAISVIGVIDLIRYLFTGTWNGFIMG